MKITTSNELDNRCGRKITDEKIIRVDDDLIITESIKYQRIYKLDGRNLTLSNQIGKMYDEIQEFIGDYAIVKADNKYGLINRECEEVLKPIYDHIKPSNDGFNIRQDGKYGYFSNDGRLIKPMFEYSLQVKDGLAVVSLNSLQKMGIFNSSVSVFDIRSGVIDLDGNTVLDMEYDNVIIVSKNRFIVTLDGKDKLIDDQKQVIKTLKSDQYKFLDNNLIFLESQLSDKIIDYDGNTVKQFLVGMYQPDTRSINTLRGSALLDDNYKRVTSYKYAFIELFNGSDVTVCTDKKNRCGLLAKDGREIIPCGQYYMFIPLGNNYFKSCVLGKYGLIHRDQIILRAEYQDVAIINDRLILKRNNKVGLFDLEGSSIAVWYDSLVMEKDGYFVFAVDNKYFLIDKDGNFILNDIDKPDDMEIKDGLIKVIVGNHYSLYNRQGKEYFKSQNLRILEIINSSQVLINNRIFYIDDLKYIYTVTLHYNEGDRKYYFENSESMDKFINNLNLPLIEEIENLKLQKKELTETYFDGDSKVFEQLSKYLDKPQLNKFLDGVLKISNKQKSLMKRLENLGEDLYNDI